MFYVKQLLFSSVILFQLSSAAFGQVRLPKLVSDGMVLQRDARVKIWGWAAPGEHVAVRFIDRTLETSANKEGEWSVFLEDLNAGGPYDMTISAGNSITISDILVGDVWVCSGQSQMDINMERVSPLYQEEIRNAGNPEIRYFSVPTAFDFTGPQKDLPYGHWESISQDNILRISAIAYFFSTELYDQYKVPVGIIRSSLGGSPAQAWISKDAIREFPEYYSEAQKYSDTALINSIRRRDRERIGAWYARLNESDQGHMDPGMPWYKPELDVSAWPLMQVPGYWADGKLGLVNGAVWFRKDIDLPEGMSGQPARLNLGRIVDADSAFVNGVYVGSTGYQYPPRRYDIPAGLLKEGRNTIVVRLISNRGRGGFVPDKPYELVVGGKSISLEGDWHYKLGAKMEPTPGQTFIRFKSTGLFNGMIAPLTGFAIKGVVWYQGESNTSRPLEYANLFPTLIRNWREQWGQGDFPFLFVQLHNYMRSWDHPTESDWALTREAQLHALSLPNTGMAVAIDLGVWNDIHPLNKKDVAKRLVLAARKIAYHEVDIVSSGPIYRSMKTEGNRIVLTFSDTGSGLIAKGGEPLKRFAIAGTDKKFVWANAKIEDDRVVVWSDKIREPVAVRYAWSDNPEGANLYNKEGLPASPFRTDHWMQKRY